MPNLLDPAHHDKSFAIGDILDCAGLPTGCVLGAASGDAAWAKGNTELMPCASQHTRRSKSARVGADGRCVLHEYDWDRVGFLANLFVCQGVPGPVLEVRARGRRLPEDHSDNFVGNIRGALLQRFPGRAIGLGGAFTMKKGLFKVARPCSSGVTAWLNIGVIAGTRNARFQRHGYGGWARGSGMVWRTVPVLHSTS